MKARIKQNRFGNWNGYLGNSRVIEFANNPEQTAQDAANEWLIEQNAGPKAYTPASLAKGDFKITIIK